MNKKRVFYRIAAILLLVYAFVEYSFIFIYNFASGSFRFNASSLASLSSSAVCFILLIVLAVMLLKTKDKPSGVIIIVLAVIPFLTSVVSLVSVYKLAAVPDLIPTLVLRSVTFLLTLLPGLLLLGAFGRKPVPGFIFAGLFVIPCASSLYAFLGVAVRFDFVALGKGIMNGITAETAALFSVALNLFGIIMYVSLALVCIGHALSCIKKS